MQPFGLRSPINNISFVLITLLALIPVASFADVTWQTDLAAAKRASAVSHKPIFVDFFATWCGPCHAMETDTFSDARVQALMKKMICVRIDVDKDEADARAYQVDGIPRTLVLSAGGSDSLLDSTGYQGPDDFLGQLSSALHLKVPAGSASHSGQDPDLILVQTALAGKTYPTLRHSNPKAAATGLNLMVKQLGVFDESLIGPTILLLSNAGDDAIPALITGMDNPTLAVRAGSYRALQTLLRAHHHALPLTFDPWANRKSRHVQVQKLANWWHHQRLS